MRPSFVLPVLLCACQGRLDTQPSGDAGVGGNEAAPGVGPGGVDPSGPPQPSGGHWSMLKGTPHGTVPVHSVQVSPKNEKVILAHQGGPDMLRSTDGGATFAHVRMRMPLGSFVGGGSPGEYDPEGPFRLHPTDEKIVYAFMQRDGDKPWALLKSSDTGTTWTEVSRVDGELLAIDPKRPERMYVAHQLTVDRSDDGGATWAAVATLAETAPGLTISRMAVAPSGRLFVYTDFGGAGGTRGLFASDDGGASFRSLLARPSSDGGFALSNDGRTVYVAIATEMCASHDEGATFACHPAPSVVAPSDPEKMSRMLDVATFDIDPTDVSTVYVLGRDGVANHILKSTDGAATWKELPLVSTHGVSAEFEHVAIVGSRVFTATTRGIFTTDDDATWNEATKSTVQPRAEWVGFAPSNPNVLYARAADSFDLGTGGVQVYLRSTDAGTTWTIERSPDTDATILDPKHDDTFIGDSLSLVFGANGADGFFDVTRVTYGMGGVSGLGYGPWIVGGLSIDPNDPNTRYLSTCPQSGKCPTRAALYVTHDGASTWTETALGHGAMFTAIHPASPSTVYAFDGRLSVSTDGGATWKSATFLDHPTIESMNAMWFDPHDANTVYLRETTFVSSDVSTHRVSHDRGLTWATLDWPVDPGATLLLDPTAAGVMYAAGVNGVWKTKNGGADWASVSVGLDGEDICGITMSPADSKRLVAAACSGALYVTTTAGE